MGAEALLRWDHPEYGQIAPSVFIDVAEQSGLIETIGPQVLRVACSDAVPALRAVVDWGDVCCGDPATDLAIAWLAFDERGRTAFREAAAGRHPPRP